MKFLVSGLSRLRDRQRTDKHTDERNRKHYYAVFGEYADGNIPNPYADPPISSWLFSVFKNFVNFWIISLT